MRVLKNIWHVKEMELGHLSVSHSILHYPPNYKMYKKTNTILKDLPIWATDGEYK
jgi:hypothetical protein